MPYAPMLLQSWSDTVPAVAWPPPFPEQPLVSAAPKGKPLLPPVPPPQLGSTTVIRRFPDTFGLPQRWAVGDPAPPLNSMGRLPMGCFFRRLKLKLPSMKTSASLLVRLRSPDDHQAWDRFVQLYAPLMYGWLRHAGLDENEASDLVQDVFLILVQKLPEFHYDRQKSFRAWLKTITLNKWRQRMRRRRPVALPADGAVLADREAPNLVLELQETEYRRDLVRRAMLSPYFSPVDLPVNRQAGPLVLFLASLVLGAAAVLFMLRLAFRRDQEAQP